MGIALVIPFSAALLALLLAAASLVRKTPSTATWCFAAGMLLLGLDSLCTGLALNSPAVTGLVAWLSLGLIAKAALPAVWLAFSLTYSRGDNRAALTGAVLPLGLAAIVPLGLALAFRTQLLELVQFDFDSPTLLLRSGSPARLLHAALLLSFVLVLMNLEQTFRAAVGTMRWRIKYVVLGLAMIFGAQIFVRSQAILYSTYNPALAGLESSALLIGGVFLVIAYARTGLDGVDVYPSRAVLRSSLTVLIVGAYLFIVGVLAQAVRRFGGAESFQAQALVVLIGLAGLAVLLASDKVRQRTQAFVGRHFRRAQHDSTRLWTDLSRRLSSVADEQAVCQAAASLISSAFDVLAVSMWRADEAGGRLRRLATTSSGEASGAGTGDLPWEPIAEGFAGLVGPFDLEGVEAPWADEVRRANPTTFPGGGRRWALPLRTGDAPRGLIVLGDRVNGVPYTVEERELLQCMADQVAAALDNLRLGDEIARGRELQAFQTMSAFFVHDLKNAASSLNLMLKNLPVHFDDPAFRADALRGIGNTARRIDDMIARLGALRQQPPAKPVQADLGDLVREAIDRLEGMSDVTVTQRLQPVPAILADRELILSVVTNLLLNARDATGAGGRIDVATEHREGRVVLSVEDNGCGMTAEFVRDSLFRPFGSTKSRGLGIGMFQSRMIVEAHGGRIHVESAVGKGTTFRVSLPANDARIALPATGRESTT